MTPNDDLLAALVTHQAHAKRMPAVVMEKCSIAVSKGTTHGAAMAALMMQAQSRRPSALVIWPGSDAFKQAQMRVWSVDIPCIIDAQELAE